MPNAQVRVYLTVHITKLQLQTTFPKPLYIQHSTCIPWGPWPLKILMFALLVTREKCTMKVDVLHRNISEPLRVSGIP